MARTQQIVAATNATVERTRQFQAELDSFGPNIEQALPTHITLDKFKRVLITAVATNPDLLYADRRTLYTAAVKCAADGLEPDGRDAALVIHNTKVKMRNPNTGLDEEFRIDAVSFMPMLAGIRRRMFNSGEVLSAEAEVVYEHDHFKYSLGDNPYIEHEPPTLGQDRGEILGAYAIIRLRSGEVIRDVMDRKRIEQARSQSRSKDSLMWTKFFDEGCKKTVMRRASKAVPQSAEMLQRMLARDDEPPVIEDIAGLPAPQMQRIEPPAPPPPVVEVQQDNEPSYVVIDQEGSEVPLRTTGATAKALTLLFAEAARQGVKQLEGIRESNEGVLQELGADDPKLFDEVIEDYSTRLDAAREVEARKQQHPPPVTPAPEPPPPAPAEPASAAPAARARAATSTAPSPGLGSTGEEVPQHGLTGQPFPADVGAVEDGTSQSWHYEPVMRNGKYDWRAWAIASFIPKMRRDVQDSTDMALCMADNEENLKRARLALHESDRRALDQAIEQKWQELG